MSRIESISAVTVVVDDMARSVRFYEALGFERLYGGESASFTSYRVGAGYLNLAPREEVGEVAGGGGRSSMSRTSTRCTRGSSRWGSFRSSNLGMRHGVSAISTCAIRMDTS